MKQTIMTLTKKLFALLLMATTLTACNTLTRLSEVNSTPQLTQIQNPTAAPNYRPVSMPMPSPEKAEVNPNSLWRNGAKAFFKDHRAKGVGDVLTVKLNLSDSAKLENKTERERDDKEDGDVTALLGYESKLAKNHLTGFDPTAAVSFGSKHETNGDGEIDRSEDINVTFAAVVTQVLPNGALVVHGRQEIRVNYEIRELMVTGVIRPEDIESDNTVTHEKIAEMRIAYGGRGTISDLQQPRWGTQIWDIIYPF